jgi:hypothetical protein
MEKTTIYLPADLRWYLKDAAERTGRSQADLIRDALEAHRAAQPQPQVTVIGIGNRKPKIPAHDSDANRKDLDEYINQKMQRRRADA